MDHRRSGLCLRFPRASTRNPHRPQFLHSAARFWYCGSPRSDGQLCPAKREGSWLGRMIAAEPALPAILESEWPGESFEQRARATCGLLLLLLIGAKEGLLATVGSESPSRDGGLRTRLRKRGTRLGWRCRWKPSLRRLGGDMAGQGHTSNAAPGWLAPGRIPILGRSCCHGFAPMHPHCY